MAGYSKGIVDTRKLNKNNKAKLGRGGDTKIREVDNRESHVNALEAYLIDVNGKAGEEYAKRVGAGTTNPLTGMPEYHTGGAEGDHEGANHQTHVMVTKTDDDGNTYQEADYTQPLYSMGDIQSSTDLQGSIWEQTNPYEGQMPDYSTLSGMTDMEKTQHLTEFDLGADDVKYFQDIFTDKPFDFLQQQQGLTTRGLKSAYGTAMGELGRTAERGLREAGKGRDTAISKSGLATSGTITQAYETQKKDLFQDYAAGRGAALDTLTLGKDTAALDLSKGIYTEQQKQLGEYWEMIGLRQAV
jgi:hypothetical protein